MARAKRLAQLAKKWQRMEALGRKRLTVTDKEDEECCTSVPAKGHCVMYTADGRLSRSRWCTSARQSLASSWGCLRMSLALQAMARSHCLVMQWWWSMPCACSGKMPLPRLRRRCWALWWLHATTLVLQCLLLEPANKFAVCNPEAHACTDPDVFFCPVVWLHSIR